MGSWLCSCNHGFVNGRGNRFPVLLKAGEVTLNRILNIGQRCFAGLALRNAPGQARAFGNKHAVFVLLDNNAPAQFMTALSSFSVREVNLHVLVGCGPVGHSIESRAATAADPPLI